MKLLVTGSTGYVGGRLTPLLVDAGHDVTVLVRDKRRISTYKWSNQVTVIEGDLLKPDTFTDQLEHYDAAYYMVHSMYAGKEFDRLDIEAATNFSKAARDKINHLIYLGGIYPDSDNVSHHLQSRARTGRILNDYFKGIITEFQAGPIIGSGSASFEMVRYLTERIPVMITPKWVDNKVRTIAIRNMLHYLTEILEKGPQGQLVVGSNPISYKEMMLAYAKERGLSRYILRVPVLAPKLAARWVGLVTPIPNSLAVPLIEGVNHPIIGDTSKVETLFPDLEVFPYEKALKLALSKVENKAVLTSWSSALIKAEHYELDDWEGLIKEIRKTKTHLSPDTLFKAFTSLGGDNGWLCWNWAWKLRGRMDKWVGGPGLRRGRRHPQELHLGEALDFWRVEKIEHNRCLLLRAEMKVPGKAWLYFEINQHEDCNELDIIALFEPKGILGLAYWYALYPVHVLIFSDMAKALIKRAEAMHEAENAPQEAPFIS